MNALPKTIFSSTLTDVEWDNARVTDRPAADAIADLKREAGKDVVVFGGASFARSLAGLDLIDEYRINVHPFDARRRPAVAAGLAAAGARVQHRLGGRSHHLHLRLPLRCSWHA